MSLSEQPATWMPRERWDALVRGDDCPLCAECQSTEPSSRRGYPVADLRLSRLRLALPQGQYAPRYCVLICHRHVIEPYHLPAEERGSRGAGGAEGAGGQRGGGARNPTPLRFGDYSTHHATRLTLDV